jgi:hypothetical protein
MLIEHVINMIASVYMSAWMPFNRLFPIGFYVLLFVFVHKYSPYPLSGLYRLYMTYFVGFMIQTVLFVRSTVLEYSPSEQ